jgi:hypothetical protein
MLGIFIVDKCASSYLWHDALESLQLGMVKRADEKMTRLPAFF